MKKLILSLFIYSSLLLLCSCSGKEGKINRAAGDYGRADAQTLIEKAPSMTPFEMEGYLLGVRATEYEYRENGHEKAADIYVNGFEEYIKLNSDSLAAIIF